MDPRQAWSSSLPSDLLNVRISDMCMVSHEISISVSLSVYSLTVLDIRLEDLPTLGQHSTLYCQPTPYCWMDWYLSAHSTHSSEEWSWRSYDSLFSEPDLLSCTTLLDSPQLAFPGAVALVFSCLPVFMLNLFQSLFCKGTHDRLTQFSQY